MDNLLDKSKDSFFLRKVSGHLRKTSVDNASRDSCTVEGVKWKTVKRAGTGLDTSVDSKRLPKGTKLKAQGQENLLLRIKGFNVDKKNIKTLRE